MLLQGLYLLQQLEVLSAFSFNKGKHCVRAEHARVRLTSPFGFIVTISKMEEAYQAVNQYMSGDEEDGLVGGHRLGEDSKYGCAFQKPLLPCQSGKPLDASHPDDVTKIAKKKDLDPEVIVGNLLRDYKIGPNYFVTPRKGICKPSDKIFQLDSDTQDCEIIQKTGVSRLHMIQMPYGGDKTVSGFFKNSAFNASQFDFYSYGRHLLEAVTLYTLKGIAHRDLHTGNILLDQSLTPRIIDFGLCFIKGHTKNDDFLKFTFNPFFAQRPPEIDLWLAKEDSYPLSMAVDRIINEKRGMANITLYSGQNPYSQKQELMKYINSSVAFRDGDIDKWMGSYWPLYDAWAIGNMLTSQYNKLMVAPGGARNKSLNNNRTAILKALRALTRLSPLERVDAVVALKMWAPTSPVLRMKAVQEWLTVREPRAGTAAAAKA